ncbi:MAG: YfiR/HmsC family protein [Sulfurimonas sp.]|nr:YfiR/HmsC family protein [Sulfurimonas sp.]
MRYLLLLIYLSTILFASSINNSVLKIHATLVPKLLLMDYDFKEKISNNTINIVITYENTDYKDAQFLKRTIEQKYKDGLKSFNLSITLISYNNINSYKTKANLYYLFPSNKQNIINIIKKAKKSHTLTFSYEKNNLQNGVMSSVLIGSKVKLILNLEAIKSSDIALRPLLLKISEIYQQKENS